MKDKKVRVKTKKLMSLCVSDKSRTAIDTKFCWKTKIILLGHYGPEMI